jgi:hypothetical protein
MNITTIQIVQLTTLALLMVFGLIWVFIDSRKIHDDLNRFQDRIMNGPFDELNTVRKELIEYRTGICHRCHVDRVNNLLLMLKVRQHWQKINPK